MSEVNAAAVQRGRSLTFGHRHGNRTWTRPNPDDDDDDDEVRSETQNDNVTEVILRLS